MGEKDKKHVAEHRHRQKYIGCWYCDNIIDYPEQVGLIHLGFPRCFVLIPSSKEFCFSNFDSFLEMAQVNWLDPHDKGTAKEQEEVLIRLWNFSVEQERKEEELYGDMADKMFDE